MANEGSTKPTEEPFVTLSYGGTFTAKNVEDALLGAQAELDKANAENLRVRGLLQRLEWAGSDGDGFPMCPVCEVEGGVPTDPHEPDCWLAKELSPTFPQSSSLVSEGAESADIGKLDSVDEKADV